MFTVSIQSFRYLAAFKQHGLELGDREENGRSWNTSVFESWRLLDYFKELEPHRLTSTLNLNEIRYQIEKQTVLMADIADTIEGTVRVNEDDIKELEREDMRMKDLEAKLKIHVSVVYPDQVNQTRTTCSHRDCVEVTPVGIDGGDGKPILKTIYKRRCHSPSYLTQVTVNTIGHSDLQEFAAMTNGICKVCGHPWSIHLHVQYEVRRASKQINDPGIEDALRRNASERVTAKAIQARRALILKLRSEQDKIKEAAAQFSNFLQRNSIVSYNDATLKYLDYRMEQEGRKVRAGGSKDNLDRLDIYRSEYEQQVKLLDEYAKKGEHHKLLDRHGAEELLKELSSLELYGDCLKKALKVDADEDMVYQEDPRVIRGKQNSPGNASNAAPPQTGFAEWAQGVLALGSKLFGGLLPGPSWYGNARR